MSTSTESPNQYFDQGVKYFHAAAACTNDPSTQYDKYSKSLLLFKIAYELGHPEAPIWLSRMYIEGLGMEKKDIVRASEYISKSIEREGEKKDTTDDFVDAMCMDKDCSKSVTKEENDDVVIVEQITSINHGHGHIHANQSDFSKDTKDNIIEYVNLTSKAGNGSIQILDGMTNNNNNEKNKHDNNMGLQKEENDDVLTETVASGVVKIDNNTEVQRENINNGVKPIIPPPLLNRFSLTKLKKDVQCSIGCKYTKPLLSQTPLLPKDVQSNTSNKLTIGGSSGSSPQLSTVPELNPIRTTSSSIIFPEYNYCSRCKLQCLSMDKHCSICGEETIRNGEETKTGQKSLDLPTNTNTTCISCKKDLDNTKYNFCPFCGHAVLNLDQDDSASGGKKSSSSAAFTGLSENKISIAIHEYYSAHQNISNDNNHLAKLACNVGDVSILSQGQLYLGYADFDTADKWYKIAEQHHRGLSLFKRGLLACYSERINLMHDDDETPRRLMEQAAALKNGKAMLWLACQSKSSNDSVYIPGYEQYNWGHQGIYTLTGKDINFSKNDGNGCNLQTELFDCVQKHYTELEIEMSQIIFKQTEFGNSIISFHIDD